MPVSPADFAAALRQHPAGVALMTVRDDTDDVGTTVTSVMSVSADPPLVAVGLAADGYPAEVLEAVGSCALTVLAAGQAILASRFSSAGRPGARHLLESVPWSRTAGSDAIVLDGGVVALDCRLDRLVPAGDHVLALLAVVGVPVLREDAAPLLRLRGRYVDAPG
ncbi:NADH-FMN oxidoreductase RutF, flavin reductase (DIM6/NTAB) family [Geodermatophilus dictyosporus]|uniref:NADH-FMN oxidoreductase RutF, flavin reductase (DIM6/NTAB) family n=1 Tax=Geodermatophilus dictyosporus TaxID=1523247 RepID=A0A1I5RS82_9ACTN|nr:flavin reductase family protein [Geodermatophilus dictyosporus]SFP61240.1 NADH-FMN oxidoreductase RutF, flavin reductase (DIM6/NTAB) family [Geodermatophilus dictyosporus]